MGSPPTITIRPGSAADLEAVARIQSESREAAQWDPAGYLEYRFTVAEYNAQLTGFLVARIVAPEEGEILNLAVSTAHRRTGAASALVSELLQTCPGTWFLEVRHSNHPALRFYAKHGFQPVGIRQNYYSAPREDAVVMRNRS